MSTDAEIHDSHNVVTCSWSFALPAMADANVANTNPSMNMPPPVATVSRCRKCLDLGVSGASWSGRVPTVVPAVTVLLHCPRSGVGRDVTGWICSETSRTRGSRTAGRDRLRPEHGRFELGVLALCGDQPYRGRAAGANGAGPESRFDLSPCLIDPADHVLDVRLLDAEIAQFGALSHGRQNHCGGCTFGVKGQTLPGSAGIAAEVSRVRYAGEVRRRVCEIQHKGPIRPRGTRQAVQAAVIHR